MFQRFCAILALITILGVAAGYGQPPQMITYQGLLTDDAGSPVADGIYTLTFRIFDLATGGTALWSETQPSVSTSGGLFKAFLGSVNTIALAFDVAYWLEVQVGGSSPQSPRVTLTTVPYSYMAMEADQVDGYHADATPTANTLLALDGAGQFPSSVIPSVPSSGPAGGDLTGTYPNPSIAADAVTSAKIQNGQVQTADIANQAVTQAKIAPDVTLPPGGAAGGDLTGTYPNPTIAESAVDSDKIQDGEVKSADIANNAVGAGKIAPDIISSIEGVSNDAGDIDLIEGANIIITSDDAANTITIQAASGGGDITSVWPGDGTLSGGGDFGDVELSVSNPLSLWGGAGPPEGVIMGTDGGTGNYGALGNNWRGVQAGTGAGPSGPWGYLAGIWGAYGTTADGGNYGGLGGSGQGAYGRHTSGNFGYLGGDEFGAYGEGNTGNFGYLGENGTARGAYGENANGNWGSLGSPLFGVYYSGGLGGSGSKNCIVRTSEGPVALYCQESPEAWFEDFGEGTLVNGRAHVELGPLFLETVTIDVANPMKVFVQLHDEACNGVAVKKGITGFDVVELSNGTSNGTFDYRIVAKRAGFEAMRLDVREEAREDAYLYPELRETQRRERQSERNQMGETLAGGTR